MPVARRAGEREGQAVSRTALSPSVNAALTATDFNPFLRLEDDPVDLVEALEQQCRSAQSGDLSRAKAMLVAQAHTLDSIFNSLTRRSVRNMNEYMGAADLYLKLALKAQSQCRSTLEALAEVVNPRPVFVQQANIANGGPQQVNNARASGNEKAADQTFGAGDGERMDGAPTASASITHSPLETVGAVDGTTHGGGKVQGEPKRLQERQSRNAARRRTSTSESES